MMVQDLQPVSIVEDRRFQELLQVLNHRYIPPSRRSIMRNHLPLMCEAAKHKLKGVLQNVEFCSITTDLWTSRTTLGYTTVTCHFLTNNWEMKSIVLDTPRLDAAHTGDNIAAAHLKISNTWDITGRSRAQLLTMPTTYSCCNQNHWMATFTLLCAYNQPY